ncbi:demethoxyubiquinone hydroxylase family protein [Pararhizobium sp. YC-54]|uniref:demethoxyubiquinone hydroxylase family protein n=1 Tax=Pararhizobium sp. YC-54 TaxID=2986920 RepID=UPI0021F77719|nr:demethoxyubiquinone hydroxylase family protein [Pararhizobium sp. YC-54]MCW0000226.1 demethoxyubiquinone hydroxylase family protein [Pararhizobium sp. YC-54]
MLQVEVQRETTLREALTIARIVKVNHAGEFGAIRIYSAQVLVARRLWPDCVPALSEMLADERRHCTLFRGAMSARKSRPCRVMQFWSYGGWMLGFLTALLGRQGIWACTAAVEAVVHRHLDDQLHFLKERDPELAGIILSIRDEEIAHLRHAEERLVSRNVASRSLRAVISMATDCLIWLSTWGDSTRMARALKREAARLADDMHASSR